MVVPKGDPQASIERLPREHGDQTVLLVGHTDTLPGLMKALGHRADIKIEPNDYGNIFVLTPQTRGAPSALRFQD